MKLILNITFSLFAGAVSYMHQFCKGAGVFEHLWRPNADGDMVFNETYSRSDAVLRQDVDISTSVMELKNFTSRELVSGRMLLHKARDTQKHVKKAASCVEKYIDENGNPKRSGWDSSRVLTQVLDDMYELLNSTEDIDGEEPPPKNNDAKNDEALTTAADELVTKDGDDDDEASVSTPSPEKAVDPHTPQPETGETESQLDADGLFDSDASSCGIDLPQKKRPSDWTFPGFMTFAYFYPLGENRSAGRVLNFMLKDPPKGERKSFGRTAARSEKEKAAAFERERDGNRGMSHMEKVLVQTCELQASLHKSNKSEAKLFSLNVRADRIVKQMELALQRASASGDWSKYDELQVNLERVNNDIEEMETKIGTPSPQKGNNVTK